MTTQISFVAKIANPSTSSKLLKTSYQKKPFLHAILLSSTLTYSSASTYLAASNFTRILQLQKKDICTIPVQILESAMIP
jgi:hypothetical protein